MFVVANERPIDLVMLEKLLCLARIFTGNHGDFLAKYPKSAKRNIFQISDGCCDEVERARQTLSSVSLSMEAEATL